MQEISENKLVDTLIALSVEHDTDRRLKLILTSEMDITNCDGGTIYTLEDDKLHFRHMFTRSKGIAASASNGTINLPPVPLGRKHVCACAALEKQPINIADIYTSEIYDFAGAKQYDALNDFHTQSMLVIPMVDQKQRVIGVVQLINAMDETGSIIPFSNTYESLNFGLSSLVAVYLNNQRLSTAFYELLHSFVQVMVEAIDLRTPYNANHTKSMVDMGSKFITWLDKQDLDWKIADEMKDPFLMSIWLHDIGKLVTPLEVMEKSTRLGDHYDVVMNRLTIARLMEELHVCHHPEDAEACNEKLQKLHGLRDLINEVNAPGFLPDEKLAAIQSFATLTCRDENDNEIPVLKENEVELLSIRKGTLTDAERRIIESHVSYTAKMLSKVRFDAEYAVVPVWAASHHEYINGKGYPNGKKGDELPNEVRLITILDVYDALTAGDRPYKAPLSSEKAFDILGRMVEDGQIDANILQLFKESNAWVR